MEQILSRPGMMHTFDMEWKMKWVPAIIGYCKSLKKKDICEVFSKHSADHSGDFFV